MMIFNKHCLILIGLVASYIMSFNGQYVCNNTYQWINSYGFSCNNYKYNVSGQSVCLNGTYKWNATLWGGNTGNYPEFNCCGCGKGNINDVQFIYVYNLEGWPLWFVLASGYTAVKAISEPLKNVTINTSIFNKLICNDSYRCLTNCSMKCKALPINLSVSSITTMSIEDFDELNCMLDLNNIFNSLSCIFQIPIDNSHMLCRYEIDQYQFISSQCTSEDIKNRYIRPNCVDSANWTNTVGIHFFEYEVIGLWCANGKFTQLNSCTGGAIFDYPERHFCACEKEFLSPFQLTFTSVINNLMNSSEIGIIHLQHCTTLRAFLNISDLKCLAFLNFYTSDTSMNTTLYDCPLDCFFDWNVTKYDQKQNVTISSQVSHTLISYYLTPDLFLYFDKVRTTSFNQQQITTSPLVIPLASGKTAFYQSLTTSESPNTSQKLIINQKHTFTSNSQSTVTSYDPNASRTSTNLPTAVRQSAEWEALICANGRIGLDCNISTDFCFISQPCVNNGTCISIPSYYICLCPPLKFIGINCEIDIRPCKTYTCFNHGECIEKNPTAFIYQCEPGYDGIHCNSLINYCHNVRCQNNEQCRPSRLNFTCECTTTAYSGRYCEMKSPSLAMIQRVNLSFAYIVILVMVSTAITILLMDVLRYGFNIDLVKPERRRLKRMKRSKVHEPKIALRFVYVNPSQLETIPEECEV